MPTSAMKKKPAGRVVKKETHLVNGIHSKDEVVPVVEGLHSSKSDDEVMRVYMQSVKQYNKSYKKLAE